MMLLVSNLNNMYGLIIHNQEIGHNAYKIDRFKEEFVKLGISLDVFVNDGTLAIIKDNNVQIKLPKADFVLYLDKDIYLARLLEKAEYRLFNKADFIKFCDDKMLTFIGCANMGIKMPKTISGPLVYYDIKESNFSFLTEVEKQLGFPMVVKKVYGSLGEGVYLAHNHEELKQIYAEIATNPIVFQEYIPSSFGKSIRVLIIDGKVFGAFIRENKTDFRSNFGDTAGSEQLFNGEKYLAFAQDIADKLNIEYAGIDLLIDQNDEPILCEINSNAFFEVFENVTHLNVAKAVGEMILRKLS